MSAKNSSKNTVAKTAEQTPRFEKREKEPTYGLAHPLTVKWEQDPIVGPYIAIVVAMSGARTPLEFVVSQLIGKSLTYPKETIVINRQKDVPELIRGAGDPMKKRMGEIAKKMDIDELTKSGLIKEMGTTFVLTEKTSVTLQGLGWDTYLDRSKFAFEQAKKQALAAHEAKEAGKPFRQRKKFIFEQNLEDFLTKDEKAVKALMHSVIMDPGHREKVEEATKSNHETLIDGERQQRPLVIEKEGWQHLNQAGMADEIGRTVLSVLTGTYHASKPDEELRKAKARVLELEREVSQNTEKVKKIHDFYKSSSEVIATMEARIATNEKIIEDLRAAEDGHLEDIKELEARVKELEHSSEEEE